MVKTISQEHSSSSGIRILASIELLKLTGAYCPAQLCILAPTASKTDPCFRDYEKLSLFQRANGTYTGNKFFIDSQMC